MTDSNDIPIPEMPKLNNGPSDTKLIVRFITELHHVVEELRREQRSLDRRISILQNVIEPTFPNKGIRHFCERNTETIRVIIWVLGVTFTAVVAGWVNQIWGQ